MWNDFWQTMSSEWTARGAAAALFSALVFLGSSSFWIFQVSRAVRKLTEIPVRILVTGSRGKSSLVRHLHSVMTEAGIAAYSKTTGTAAVELSPYGVALPTKRNGQVSILEMIETLKRAEQYPRPIQVMVFECMAVSPRLIRIVSERFFKPNIVVITNALLDHLEEEGKSHIEIATSLSNAIRYGTEFVVTADSDPACLSVYQLRCDEVGAKLITAAADQIPAAVKAANSFLHPANVAITWSISKYLKIADPEVISGLINTSIELSDRTTTSWKIAGRKVQVIDFGSINDIESLHFAADFYSEKFDSETARIPLLVNRWDRPLRALSFAGSLNPAEDAGVILAGDLSWLVKRYLCRHGWKSRQVLVLTDTDAHLKLWQSKLQHFLERIAPEKQPVNILLLENIHNLLADHMRKEFSGGRAHEQR